MLLVLLGSSPKPTRTVVSPGRRTMQCGTPRARGELRRASTASAFKRRWAHARRCAAIGQVIRRACRVLGAAGGVVLLSLLAESRAFPEDYRKILPPPPMSITAAVLRTFPPQYSTDPAGNPRGFAIDVMDAVARRANLTVRYFQTDSWDEQYAALRTGRADLIPNLGISDSRRTLADFTDPIETFSVSLFVRSNSPEIEGIADLKGRPVAVVHTNIGADLIREYGGMTPMEYDDVEQALGHLLSGSADALIFPEPIVWKVARAIGLERRIAKAGPPLLEVKRAIGVAKNRPELVERLNVAIESLIGSDEYQQIYAKWYGEPPSIWSDATVWWAIGAAFGAVVLLMGAWRFQGVVRLNRQLGEESRERARAEEQLRQAQKMEAVGRLAGGVAHDFNNMLQIIQGYVELAANKLGAQHSARVDLEKVLQAAISASTLTRQLLAFSRREALQLRTMEVNELIAQESAMLRRLIGEDIELATELSEENPLVRADGGMMAQALMNLAVNARDAMPRGGRIVVETQAIVADEAFCRVHGWAKPGPYVMITVSDTGTGMSPHVQRRIFDPFFTTKESGRGTGLGLSIVYGIVQQHDGMITMYSEEGVGTTFRIYLPRVAAPMAQSDTLESGEAPGGTETLLVAEDEPEVLGLLVELLRSSGYQVLTASNGAEAIEQYRRNHNLIDLVVLDVVMPKLGGRAAYEEIRRLDGDVPILFSTGHTANVIDSEFIAQHRSDLIRKPYSPSELLRSVRTALDSGSRGSTARQEAAR